MSKEKPTIQQPESINPFVAMWHGVVLTVSKAVSVAVLLVITSVCIVTGNNFITAQQAKFKEPAQVEQAIQSLFSTPTTTIALYAGVVLVISLSLFIMMVMVHGIQSYTAVMLSKGNSVTVREAFDATLAQFGSYIILMLWMYIKIALWSMLFIIPGVVAYYRYSFAGLLFFENKKYRGNAALEESTRLTKKGLLTLFASQYVPYLLTLGYGGNLSATGSLTTLYATYTDIAKKKLAMPRAHLLSYASLAVPFILFIVALSIVSP